MSTAMQINQLPNFHDISADMNASPIHTVGYTNQNNKLEMNL